MVDKKEELNRVKKDIEEKLRVFNDDAFLFVEDTHTYTYKGEEYSSVTTFLKTFKEEFKKEYWARKKAEERGITPDEILAEWQGKADVANELGTAVHAWIEEFWLGLMEDRKIDYPEIKEVKERALKFVDIFESKLYQFIPLKPELKVFSKKWKLAGTIDQPLLFWDSKLKRVLVVIGDWKTNKEFKDDEHKKGRYQKLLRPFNHLYANSHNEYSLQISLYRLILEEAGIKTDSGFLCHIGPDGPAKLYPAKDLRELLKVYLDNNRTNNEIDIFGL